MSQLNKEKSDNYEPFDRILSDNPQLSDYLTEFYKIDVIVKHNGFWVTKNGLHIASDDISCQKNSVILDPKTKLYVYKLAFRHLLLSLRIIEPCDIDSQNLVPHIAIRKNKYGSLDSYSQIQNKEFTIGSQDVCVRNDFILLELDRSRDLHTTLIYKKRIKDKIDLMKCFKLIIRILDLYPNMASEYSSLPYFGQEYTKYWYDTPESFPFIISPR